MRTLFVQFSEKPIPIVSIKQHHWKISIASSSVQLRASCRAMRGHIDQEWWEYLSSPEDVGEITPNKEGHINFTKAGTYRFQYKCNDSYGELSESAGSIVRVAVKPAYVLGIDLGTSTTCVTYMNEDGKKEDIKLNGDEDDEPCMPSVVAFADNGELLIGKKALNQIVINPLSTIYEVKRLMGRSVYDVDHNKFLYRVRPTLKSHSPTGNRAAIEIPCKGYPNKLLQPEVVSALILHRVADIAEKKLGVAIKDAIISVPVQFDDAQRKATIDAGRIAGLNLQKVVNEPIVAAFAAAAFIDDMRGTEDLVKPPEPNNTRASVVVDIGGGTSDFSFMQIRGSYYKVVTTDGNNVGGRDIDIRLTEKITEIFQKQQTGLAVDFKSPQFQQNLRTECEKAKRELSVTDNYTLSINITVPSGYEIPLKISLNRSEFESYISDILDVMIKPLNSLLSRGNITREHVVDLYLVGGIVQIPKLRQLLQKYFPNVTDDHTYSKDPVQSVSQGAAKFGGITGGIIDSTWMPHVDVIPLPIKIVTDHDNMSEIFERSRLYPCSTTVNLTTYTDNQTAIGIQTYEGECNEATDECHFLGEFKLSGITALPKGVPKIQATFTVDSNGTLNVTASYNDTNISLKNETNLYVYSKTGSMSHTRIAELSSLVGQLVSFTSIEKPKCSLLESVPPIENFPTKPNELNVLDLVVDSQYGCVKMSDDAIPDANLSVVAMVTIKGHLPRKKDILKMSAPDIVLILDTSNTMNASRMQLMKNLTNYMIKSMLKENHRLGIVGFNDKANHIITLASATKQKKKDWYSVVDAIKTSGGRNTYDGILSGLKMAFEGGRRACVMLFTDGDPSAGQFKEPDIIVQKIAQEKLVLKAGSPKSQVDFHTFGISAYQHCQDFLIKLVDNIGNYHKVNSDTDLETAFTFVVSDAINQVAEAIQVTISPSSPDRVEIIEAMTKLRNIKDGDSLTVEVPTLAIEQSRHIILKLTVPPSKVKINYEELIRVEITYKNVITEKREEGDEYLYVARTPHWDKENLDVIGQRNRVEVALKLESILKYINEENRDDALNQLKDAQDIIDESATKEHSLSMCIKNELAKLKQMIETNLDTVKRPLNESLRSHWDEKEGWSSCYLTRKENTMITVVRSNITAA